MANHSNPLVSLKSSEHPEMVVSGATVECKYGNKLAKLLSLSGGVKLAGKTALTNTDRLITPNNFGICKYLTDKAEKDWEKKGKKGPKPEHKKCQPKFEGEWKDADSTTTIGFAKIPALTMKCTLKCKKAPGIIKIKTSGQAASADELDLPDNWTEEENAAYRKKLSEQLENLRNEGWSEDAIRRGYLANIQKTLEPTIPYLFTYEMANAYLDTMDEKAHTIGSDVFTSMMNYAYPNTKEGARQTLDMINKILGAEIDGNNFLQLDNVMNGKYSFPTDKQGLEQYFKFTESYSKLIQDKYPNDKKLDAPIDHQMRYWLDKPIVDYINDKLPVGDGETKASAYLKWVEKMGLVSGNPEAGYHNRTENKNDPNPENEKITVGHIEIIFTHDGNNTVSMWNHLDTDDTGLRYISEPKHYEDDYQNIANTDSANYSDPKIKNGKYQNSGDRHELLDVKFPEKNEPKLRLEAKDDYKKTHDYKTDLEKIRGDK